MANRIVQAVYDLKDNITGKLRTITEALGANRKESGKTSDAVERDNKRTSESYKETAKSLGFLRENLGKIAAAAAAAGAAMKLVQFGTSGFKGAATVEQSLSRVRALAESTADEFVALSEQIDRSAIAANVSTTTAASAAAALAEQGQTAREIFDALTPTLLLAKAAQIEVADAAGILDDSLDLFGKTAGDSAVVVDQLVAASKGAKEGLTGMADAIRTLAPDAKAIGIDFEQLVGLLGLLGQNGFDAAKAGEGLRVAFQKLKDPASLFSKELAKLGDSSGDFGHAIETLRAAGDQGQDALRGLEGSSRSLALFLIDQAPGAVDRFTAALGDAQGTASRTAAVLDDNLMGSFASFTNALDRLGEGLLETSLSPLRKELERLAGQLTEFAASPDFEELRTALGTLFDNGTEAFDNFIQSLDWDQLIDGAKDAFTETGKSIGEFKDDLESVAKAINQIGASIGVAFRAIAVVFDLAKTGLSGATAAQAEALVAVSRAADKLTGTTSKLTIALESLETGAKQAASEGLAGLRDNSEKLVLNLEELGILAGETTPKVEGVAGSLGKVEKAAKGVPETVRTVTSGFNAVTGSVDSVANALGILPELFHADAAAANKAASAHESHTQEVLAARQAVDEARAALVRLSQSGEQNSVAFQAAANALQAAEDRLASLTRGTDAATGAQRKLEQAFQGLRITSQAQLQATAAEAQSNFDIIVTAFQSGTASIEDVKRAFVANAAAQRAAVADSTQATQEQVNAQLAAQAATLGLGEALVSTGEKGAEAGKKVEEGFRSASGAIDSVKKSAEDLADSTTKAAEGVDDLGKAAASAAVSAQSAGVGLGFMTSEAARAFEGVQGVEAINRVTQQYRDQIFATREELDAYTRAQERAAAAQERSRQTLADLQEQLLQEQGDTLALEELRHERVMENLRTEAEAGGSINVAEFNEAKRLEEELHRIKLEKIKERAREEKRADAASARSDADNDRKAAEAAQPASRPSPLPQQQPSKLEILLNGRDLGVLENMTDAQVHAFARRIAPDLLRVIRAHAQTSGLGGYR